MDKAAKRNEGSEQTKLYTMCTMDGVLQVEVKNGEIFRVRPLPLREEDIKSARWKIVVDGKTFGPPTRIAVAPYSLQRKISITEISTLKRD